MKGIKNPEARLGVRVLSITGFIILVVLVGGYIFIQVRSPLLLKFSKGIEEESVDVQLDSLEGAHFIQGLQAVENLYLPEDTSGFYATDLTGRISYLDHTDTSLFSVVLSRKIGSSVLGIAPGPGHKLYVAVTGEGNEWKREGGCIFEMTRQLDTVARITGDFPAINGVAIDSSGNLYFASSNFRIFHPRGALYGMKWSEEGMYSDPEPLFDKPGLYNGLYYDPHQDKIYFSNTIGGVYAFTPGETITETVYLKLRFMEACDDLCTDIAGNVWMTDPGYSTVKMYNPGTGRLIRFNIAGAGQTSSVRIRTEDGKEILYLSELKKTHQPTSAVFDGRGVLRVPSQSLLGLLKSK